MTICCRLRHGALAAIAGLLMLPAVVMSSPLTTALQPRGANPGSAAAAEIVAGFAACNPVAALPQSVFTPLGVKYLTPAEAASVPLAGNGLKNRNLLLLRASANGHSAKSGGKYRVWSGMYVLANPLVVSNGIKLLAVGEEVSFESGPRPELSVSFRFNRPLSEVRPVLERIAGRPLRGSLDFSRIDPAQVGYEFDMVAGLAETREMKCIRMPE